MKKSINEIVEDILTSEDRYYSKDGKLLKNLVIEDAQKMDANLIQLLFDNETLRSYLFVKVKDIYIFDKHKFCWILSNKSFLPDSFTSYLNKIGLGDNRGSFISSANEIQLLFPYKDCVLEGGQTKEKEKKNEVFYNELLAPEQVSTLLAPKALCNAKRIDRYGSHEVLEFTDSDNLIIKGNNLLALSSLLERFERKVKLIYIDPPFNTHSDDFNYNDDFNHSSWLVFMKNRLELAKRLLKNDGTIFVHIGNEEASYIQVLLDEIFGRENYLNHITMTTNAPSGFKATSGQIFSTSNHIFVYSKDITCASLNKQYVKKPFDSAYKYILLNPEEDYTKWKYEVFYDKCAEENGFKSFKEMKEQLEEEEREIKLLKYMDAHKKTVFRIAAISGGALEKRRETVELSKNNRRQVYKHPNEDIDNFYILNGQMIIFWNSTYKEVDGKEQPAMALTDVWTDISFTGISGEGNVTLKNGKKPEKLLKRIIDIGTDSPDDIVLDFFLGSGTTAAVAHKMGRKYIGIEQLDYGKNDCINRIKNVIDGDPSGVSRILQWKGGGSFICCNLAKLNQRFVDKINNATDDEEITKIINEIKDSDFVSTAINPNDINTSVKEFSELTFSEKKEFAIMLLDKNQLYVNLSERNDPNMNLSINDISFTDSFYGVQK